MNALNELCIELPYISVKVVLLKNFLQKLLNFLDEDEKIYLLNLYPPSEYLYLWKTIGLNLISVENNQYLNALMELVVTKFNGMKNHTTIEEVVISVIKDSVVSFSR